MINLFSKKKSKKLTKEEKRAITKKKTEDRIKINRLNEDWIKTMAYMGLYNSLEKTFALSHIKVKDFGFECNIVNADGLTLRDIENERNIAIIEDNLGCKFVTTRVPKSKHCKALFITNDIPDVDFKPIKLKPWELYMSTGLDGEPMIANMLKYPHVLVQGATNMGKSKFLDLMLVNLLTTSSENDVQIFIAQADKTDQTIYKRCKHCGYYAKTLREIYALTRYLTEIVDKRLEILEPIQERGNGENIYDYNLALEKKQIKGNKWRYMYFVIDEYASLMPEGETNNENKIIKQAIQAHMERLIAIGRACGLYILMGTQRATVDKLPSFLKAMSNVMVTFKVNNKKSSEIAIDSDEAVSLRQRDFITKTDEKYYGRTVNLYPKMIDSYLEPLRWSRYNPMDLSFYDNSVSLIESKSSKGKRKTKQERKLEKENISKCTEKLQKTIEKTEISDKISEKLEKTLNGGKKVNKLDKHFIEDWQNPLDLDGINVIDKTKIDLRKTEKPRRR
ncbi:FtsK/SpoIIIE domain-containing protein [Clostridium sp.]|uniref:FtsK/SpoIIIE domain-containing protein n=1 Tax=Clostridium sp. TaxID=1506 RepID=UPI00290670BE|nr:FtsK/SpoIIIE domain-containing protein [Clostridium sp.]MDU3410069.1 FtsK/SpoIIIE domain-containing protein [Clostridium sp.]